MCAQLLNQHVSAQPGVATVATGRGVDGDQPVMEKDGDLIHRLHPIGDVGQQNRHLHADLSPALFQRPGPLLAEQPEQSSLDVLLFPDVLVFPFVELASVDQMGAPQTLQLLAIQWRSPLGPKAYCRSQRSAPGDVEELHQQHAPCGPVPRWPAQRPAVSPEPSGSGLKQIRKLGLVGKAAARTTAKRTNIT